MLIFGATLLPKLKQHEGTYAFRVLMAGKLKRKCRQNKTHKRYCFESISFLVLIGLRPPVSFVSRPLFRPSGNKTQTRFFSCIFIIAYLILIRYPQSSSRWSVPVFIYLFLLL